MYSFRGKVKFFSRIRFTPMGAFYTFPFIHSVNANYSLLKRRMKKIASRREAINKEISNSSYTNLQSCSMFSLFRIFYKEF